MSSDPQNTRPICIDTRKGIQKFQKGIRPFCQNVQMGLWERIKMFLSLNSFSNRVAKLKTSAISPASIKGYMINSITCFPREHIDYFYLRVLYQKLTKCFTFSPPSVPYMYISGYGKVRVPFVQS